MTSQLEMFRGTVLGLVPADPPRQPHSATSREAAARIVMSGCRNKLQELVWRFIANRGDWGATDEEIAVGLNLRSDTARARRCELRDGGLIR